MDTAAPTTAPEMGGVTDSETAMAETAALVSFKRRSREYVETQSVSKHRYPVGLRQWI
jgi:hypothetical protein